MSKLVQDMPEFKVNISPKSNESSGESIFNINEVVGEIERYLGVDAGTPLDVKNRLQTIIEVAAVDSKTNGDVLLKIKEFQRRIGASYYGSESINRMYGYAKLMKNKLELDKFIKAYEVENAT